MSKIEAYEDSGYIGTYAQNTTMADVAKPILQAVSNVSTELYRSQLINDALSFQNELLTRRESIRNEYANDPEGYGRAFDSMVGEVVSSAKLSGDRKRYERMAEDTKRSDMIGISRDLQKRNLQRNKELARNIAASALSQVPDAVELMLDKESGVQEIGREKLIKQFTKAMDVLVADDGKLMTPKQRSEYIDQYNGAIKTQSMLKRIADSETPEGVEELLTELRSGELRVSNIKQDNEREGVKLEQERVPYRPQDLWIRSMEKQCERRKRQLETQTVSEAQKWKLNQASRTQKILGATREVVDSEFDSMRQGLGPNATPDQIVADVGRFAESVDGVPSQLSTLIRGLVNSGANDQIRVAEPYLRAYYQKNPRALSQEFRDNLEDLSKAFALTMDGGVTGQTDTKMRDRNLKGVDFNRESESEESQAAFDRMIAEEGGREVLGEILYNWMDNGRRMTRSWDKQGEGEHMASDLMIATMQSDLKRLLMANGGNMQAAKRALEVQTSALSPSALNPDGPLMENAPQHFPGFEEKMERVRQLLEGRARALGLQIDVDEEAEYEGSELYETEQTEEDVRALQSARKNDGLDYVMVGDKKVHGPTYMHVVKYKWGGVPVAVLAGEFNPWLEMQS